MNFTGITTDLLRQVTRIITHVDCPDGIASAMILHDALPGVPIEFIHYNSPTGAAGFSVNPKQYLCQDPVGIFDLCLSRPS